MTNEKEIILKIVEEKNKRIREKRIPELLHLFLFGDGGGEHWSAWINNHDDEWKQTLIRILKYKQLTFTNLENGNIKINIELIEGELIQFEYSNKFRHVIDNNACGELIIYINRNKLIEFDLSKQYAEWGTTVTIEKIKYLNETYEIDILEEFLLTVEEFISEYDEITKKRKAKERLIQLKESFNITEQEINKLSWIRSPEPSRDTYKAGFNIRKFIKKHFL